MIYVVVNGFRPSREQTVGVSHKKYIADKMCRDIRKKYFKEGKIPKECIEDVIKVLNFNENTAYVDGEKLAYFDEESA